MLKGIRYKVGRDTLRNLYKSIIRPVMEYADVLWDGCSDGESELLESVQYEVGKVVTGAMKGTSRVRLMTELGWEDTKTRGAIHKLVCYFTIVNNLSPSYLKDLLPPRVCERTQSTLPSSQLFTSVSQCVRSDIRGLFSLLQPKCGTILTWIFVNVIQLALLRDRYLTIIIFQNIFCLLTMLLTGFPL